MTMEARSKEHWSKGQRALTFDSSAPRLPFGTALAVWTSVSALMWLAIAAAVILL